VVAKEINLKILMDIHILNHPEYEVVFGMLFYIYKSKQVKLSLQQAMEAYRVVRC
jgi:hypothetical protein